MAFLYERRYESRGDSKNNGLVLAAQSMEDIATWQRFASHHEVRRDCRMSTRP